MSKSDSLDTNCLLRWLLNDLPEQSNLVAKLISTGSHHVADIALIEFVYVLEKLYGYPRDLVAANLTVIIEHPNINSNRQLFASALPIYTQHPALSFTDCCLATYAELNQAIPLQTFDKKLAAKLPQAQLLR